MRGTRRRRSFDDTVIVEADSEIVTECEAFLGGTFVDTMREQGRPAPVWMWLNDAAHGDVDHLCRIAASELAGDIEVVTRATIARAVICATEDRDLLELQRSHLIPLELSIAGTELTPRRLVELVGRALYL